MEKDEFMEILTESANHPEAIRGIYNWCDRWCERCGKTACCTVYKTSVKLPVDKPEDFFKSLSMIFDATMDMIKKYSEKVGIDIEALQQCSDFTDEYEREQTLIRNSDSVALTKQYGKQVKLWLESLQSKESYGMEIRLQDSMVADCLEVIQWYQYLFEVKMRRALSAQKDEKEWELNPYDSLGNAKLLLVSVERNIGAWGYIYQKFPEDEDVILDILVCLQSLGKRIEKEFPDAQKFIRPGLDEPLRDMD